jgi:hypothetical protein
VTARGKVTRYEIRDATGRIVAVHGRRDHPGREKEVWWEQPAGTRGLGELHIAELPMYGIDRLRNDAGVVICEGEKAADALWAAGTQALATVTGAASCPGPLALGELTGRQIVLWPDNDAPGHKHMDRVSAGVAGIDPRVRRVGWAEAAEHDDAADFLFPGKSAADLHDMASAVAAGAKPYPPTGHRLEELHALIEAAEPLRAEMDIAVTPMTLGVGDSEAGQSGAGGRRGASQPSQLVALAEAADLFHTPDQEPYATIAFDDHVRTVELRSREMKGWLRRRYFAAHESAAGSRAIDEAVDELEAMALFEGPEHPVHLRVAEHDGRFYVDLGDRSGRAIEIGGGDWQLIRQPPVRFRRSPSLFALPEPVRGGSIGELRPFVNVADDAGFRILVSYLLAAYRPSGPYPVLVIRAEQGAAKTSTARVLRRLIDPARSLEIGVPRDQEGLLVAAQHHHIVSIDNVSTLPNWLSDDLSRLATGAGVALRVKYSTLDELSLFLCRPVILNGIEDFVARADLADRSWIVELPALPDVRKRDENEFAVAYDAAAPRILGAVLDAVAAGHRGVGDVRLTPATRMVGAARFVVASEAALSWPPGAFEADLAEMRAGSRDSALEASPLTAALVMLAEEGGFEGTADDLRKELEKRVDERTAARRDWPKTARGISGHLRRLVPDLRSRQIDVLFDQRESHTRRRLISVSKVSQNTVPTVPTVAESRIDGDSGQIAANPTVPRRASVVPNVPMKGDDGDGRGRSPTANRPPESVLKGRSGDGGNGLLSLLDERGREERELGAIAGLRARLDGGALEGHAPVALSAGETIVNVPLATSRWLSEAEGHGSTAADARAHLERLVEALGASDSAT